VADAQLSAARLEVAFGGGKIVSLGSLLAAIIVAIASTSD
jgi:hypothetical protein